MSAEPTPLIFDTDIGNDVDDVLALGVIHALQSRRECKLVAVTVTKAHELSAPFVDAVNTFYGRGAIPIGVVDAAGPTPEASSFTTLAETRDAGVLRYPHDLTSGSQAAPANAVLRHALAAADDGTVVIVQVGFSTNLAALLDSTGDAESELSGTELVRRKVRLLSVMAGNFNPPSGGAEPEFNVKLDVAAAQKLVSRWPTPIVFSGFEVGLAVPYPAVSIERDFAYVAHHPLANAYRLYNPPPHERPTWDLTSVLYAVRPDRGYFDVSPPGRVTVSDAGITQWRAEDNGPHRYLSVTADQAIRVREALAELASEPPTNAAAP